jgi:hypothetical protein
VTTTAESLLAETVEKREAVRELLARTPDEYSEIRDLWKAHSLAEDARDIGGLIATFTDDCVYELVQSGHRWEGHAGATQFYLGLLGAFPDIEFNLTHIVIGPQGVCEEAVATGPIRPLGSAESRQASARHFVSSSSSRGTPRRSCLPASGSTHFSQTTLRSQTVGRFPAPLTSDLVTARRRRVSRTRGNR